MCALPSLSLVYPVVVLGQECQAALAGGNAGWRVFGSISEEMTSLQDKEAYLLPLRVPFCFWVNYGK